MRVDLAHVPGSVDPPTVPGVGGRQVVVGPHGPVLSPPPKGSPIIFPWWMWEAPGSTDWELNALNFVAAAAVAGVPTTTPVPATFNYVTSVGNRAVCALLTVTVLNPTTTMDLKFRLLVNGGPVAGWSAVYLPPLSATAFVKDYNSLVIRMKEGDVLTADVTESSGAAFTCSLQARGWSTPQNVIDQFSSGVPY